MYTAPVHLCAQGDLFSLLFSLLCPWLTLPSCAGRHGASCGSDMIYIIYVDVAQLRQADWKNSNIGFSTAALSSNKLSCPRPSRPTTVTPGLTDVAATFSLV